MIENKIQKDAARYRKLQMWMSSNVIEGWSVVEQLGAVAAWEGHDSMDKFLDSLEECNVGLSKRQTDTEPEAVSEQTNLTRKINEMVVQDYKNLQQKTELVWSFSLGEYIRIPRQAD